MSSGLRSDTADDVRARAVRLLRRSPAARRLRAYGQALQGPPTLESTTLSDRLRANAEFVLTTLTGAGVPHRLAGSTPRDRFLVEVPPEHRDAALTALFGAADESSAQLMFGVTHVRSTDQVPREAVDGEDLTVHIPAPGFIPRPGQNARAATIVRFAPPATSATSAATPGRAMVAEAPGDGADAALPMLPFPVDIVYTWVDDSDPAWLERKHHALESAIGHELNFAATAAGRFKNRDELRYSLRSIWQFAPWVNHIYIVTDDQYPAWLNTDHPKVDVVPHREIFDPGDALPVFNSHAIESQLHHIDGLSEHYLYMNDDFLFGRPIRPNLFFHSNGIAKFYRSHAQIPLGEPSVQDAPVDAAAKNVRTMLRSTFGRTVSQKFKHTPQPQQRSLLYEMEDRYREEFHRTARSRFRQHSDVSIPSSLQHHYAYLAGRSVEGSIQYRYVGLDDHERSMGVLARLLAERRADCYCVNDADVPDAEVEWADDTLVDFFSRYYPFPCEYEV